MCEVYKDHDVFLFTSLRDSFGIQLLEAMAFALPIVCLNHHGARDFVPEGAGVKVPVIAPEETADYLALALKRLWINVGERLSMGRFGHEFARTQSWERKIETSSVLYKTVLG